MARAMLSRVESWKSQPKDLLAANVAFNIGIAGEHVALMAVGARRRGPWPSHR